MVVVVVELEHPDSGAGEGVEDAGLGEGVAEA